jgi:hypothetical protein
MRNTNLLTAPPLTWLSILLPMWSWQENVWEYVVEEVHIKTRFVLKGMRKENILMTYQIHNLLDQFYSNNNSCSKVDFHVQVRCQVQVFCCMWSTSNWRTHSAYEKNVSNQTFNNVTVNIPQLVPIFTKSSDTLSEVNGFSTSSKPKMNIVRKDDGKVLLRIRLRKLRTFVRCHWKDMIHPFGIHTQLVTLKVRNIQFQRRLFFIWSKERKFDFLRRKGTCRRRVWTGWLTDSSSLRKNILWTLRHDVDRYWALIWEDKRWSCLR